MKGIKNKWLQVVAITCSFLPVIVFIAVAESRSIPSHSNSKSDNLDSLRRIRSPEEEEYIVIQGDILIPIPDPELQSSAILDETNKWKDARIPYQIADHYTEKERQMIDAAIKEFHDNTCIRFIQIDKEFSEDYLFIRKKAGQGCSSYVGNKFKGPQSVFLNEECFNIPGVVQHELMHAAGFYHEQSRTDRDDYVTVHLGNIRELHRENFGSYSNKFIQLLNTPYDTESIMHYPSFNDFAIDRSKPTITKKDGGTIELNAVFSKTDILDLNRLYNCSNPDDEGMKGAAGEMGDCKYEENCSKDLTFNWQDKFNGTLKFADNCDFSGFDIAPPESSSDEECGRLCMAKSSCSHYTWVKDTSLCWLKAAHNPVAVPLEGATCGWVLNQNYTLFQWQEGENSLVTWAYGCEFRGHDIDKIEIAEAQCGKLCIEKPMCTHFTYNFSDSHCYLKSAVRPTAWSTNDKSCGWVNS